MAITKNHAIDTMLKTAIDYILNPAKTDEKLLVSSFGCSPETADLEFERTRQYAIDKGKHLARHIIQLFKPGETTPEQAYEIGMKLADEIFGGRFEFIVSTHTDRGHIHNHIICNDVSFVDYKHIHINKKWYYNTRRISDRICREYGLSVIEPSAERGKSYTEYTAAKNGTSWKAKLKQMIDALIPRAKDFDDFLRLMQENGYEVKQGKYISFRAEGQERFTRSKTIGVNYTEEAIAERIAGKRTRKQPRRYDKRISLLIDIQNSIKAQQSGGYEHWAKINNLQQASKTINFLTENGIHTYEDLIVRVDETSRKFDETADSLKATEKKIEEINMLKKNIQTYQTLKPIYAKYRKAKNKDDFEREHRREIILFETARKYLSSVSDGNKLPIVEKLNMELAELTKQKQQLYAEYRKSKKALSEMDIIKANVDTILDVPKRRNREPEIE